MAKHYNWVPGCGGTEEEFTGHDGKTYQYMWNQQTGTKNEHAYYCKEDDMFLDATECAGRIWPR